MSTAVRAAPARRLAPARPAPAPRRRHLAVVDPKARSRERRRRWAVRGGALLAVLAVLSLVGFRVLLAEGQMQLERLDGRTALEQRRYEELRLAHAQAAAPQAVIARATRLGMVPAPLPRYVSAPGVVSAAPSAGADSATTSTLADGWEKVKPHLVARP